MGRFLLTLGMLVFMTGSAHAVDLERLCAKFALMKDPDARVYRGEFENGRPHALVVVREQGTDTAKVLYAYEKRPHVARDREGCRRARGRFKDNILTVKLNKFIRVKYTFDGDKVAVRYRRVNITRGDLMAE